MLNLCGTGKSIDKSTIIIQSGTYSDASGSGGKDDNDGIEMRTFGLLGETHSNMLKIMCDDNEHRLLTVRTIEDLTALLNRYDSDTPIVMMILHVQTESLEQINNMINDVRVVRGMPAFLCIYLDPSSRNQNPIYSIESTKLIQGGASMVTESIDDIMSTIAVMKKSMMTNGRFSCPICRHGGIAHHLDRNDICSHIFLFHPSEEFDHLAMKIPKCPICKQQIHKIGSHLHNDHGPEGVPNETEMALSQVYPFCLVVVRRRKDGRFLLVNEVANMGWWLPGGRVNLGESLQAAAIRETKEEAGIDVEIKGILRYEYSPHSKYSRMRVIFYAEPVNDDQLPKSIPDYESMGAAYVSLEEISQLSLRGKEPKMWFRYLKEGGIVYPIEMLTVENARLELPSSKAKRGSVSNSSPMPTTPSTPTSTPTNNSKSKQHQQQPPAQQTNSPILLSESFNNTNQ